MKKTVVLLLTLICFLAGCRQEKTKIYEYRDFTLFDTVTTIAGTGESEEAFRQEAEQICSELQTYHRLFHIYQEYDGINNLKTVNDQAGIAPVEVEQPILDLLKDCRDYWILSDEKVNVAMGGVLDLWHQAREQALKDPQKAFIPSTDERTAAARHCNMQDVVLDFEKKTVYLKDPEMRLDVGAVAKGWAAQRAAEKAPEGMLISVGGNVCATGPKPDGSPWIVGIQDPHGEGCLQTVPLTRGSLVTSGDYQRYFTVDGKKYHHIIDPDSLWPGEKWSSVTVRCRDSGLADSLSTALFLLPEEQGLELLKKVDGEAMWVDREGKIFYSPGFIE